MRRLSCELERKVEELISTFANNNSQVSLVVRGDDQEGSLSYYFIAGDTYDLDLSEKLTKLDLEISRMSRGHFVNVYQVPQNSDIVDRVGSEIIYPMAA